MRLGFATRLGKRFCEIERLLREWTREMRKGESAVSLSFEILRPDDLLALRVDAVNLKLEASDPENPRLVVEKKSLPAYLVVHFPPQSIIEKAYFETAPNVDGTPGTDDPLNPAGSVPSRMAGDSRLVFQLPTAMTEIAFHTEALLDWSKLVLVLSQVALGKQKTQPITPPQPLETALELPYRLLLSPAGKVGWLHTTQPATHAGKTELWHTRAGKFVTVKSGTGNQQELIETDLADTIPLRAIWASGFVDHGPLPATDDPDFLTAMSQRDRAEIVILTSGSSGYFDLSGRVTTPWVPQPIQASRLFLSSLGGWLSSRGSWPTRPFYVPTGGGDRQSLDLSEWVHLATAGRDHYVRIVYEGFLYPFGHRAALIKVTERKVVPRDGGTVAYPTAYLKQHMYVVVREPEKRYGSAPFTFDKREMPLWQSVRIETKVTPDIDKPANSIANGGTVPTSFWINVGGKSFPFHLSATDLAGKKVNFLGALIFTLEEEPHPETVRSVYKGSGNRRLCSVAGQKIAFASPSAGDTSLKTQALFFDTEPVTNAVFPDPSFVPVLDQATVTVPALEQILGTADPVTIQMYAPYLSGNMDPHAGVYAEVSGTPPSIVFSADKAGGFATPNLQLTALSARKGLIAGNADDAAAGLIDPKEFFADLNAKLFGKVPLQALIPVDGTGKANADLNAPLIKTSAKPNAKAPETLITKVTWAPQLQDYTKEDDPVQVNFNMNEQTSALTLKTQLTRSLTGAAPQSDISGEMTNFMVSLLGAIAITFNSLKFSSKNGQKLIVKADLPTKTPITFIGPLEFVQKLADILPPGIFGGKGPSIDLKPDMIRVTYTLGLPPISIGVFSLEHIAIMVGLDLPYLDGNPAFEFAFASRGSPFLLTIECLGGGGFVHIVLDANGIQMVEGALEFGGEFSLDLGVASGGVRIMAGIYFKLTGTSTDLTGFVDVSGYVSVLGIISISLDLNLSLSYQVSNGKKMVQGRATLTVSIHILFFSASVQISMEKSFGNTSGDPRISDVLSAADWAEYAGAFA
jgi:hypothetical protein